MSDFSASSWSEAFVSDTAISRTVSRAVAAGKLRKLASRLYTRNLTDPAEAIVRRNLWPIVAGYYPGGLIADRTALENAPAEDGSVCLVTKGGKDVTLPGLTLRPRRGQGPHPTDRPFVSGLYLSSTARAFLENMKASRARSGQFARTLSRKDLEARLEAMLRMAGEGALNTLRDEARSLAAPLALDAEWRHLNELIGTLLGTRDATLSAPTAKARKLGKPYDPQRLDLFQTLHAALRNHPPVSRLAPQRGPEGHGTLAFFEAYFSNFIEGTEFEVAEAAGIVFDGRIPAERPEDAHDVLGTWRLVSDASEMTRIPARFAELTDRLKHRHATVMSARPDKRPGEFKSTGNRAGATVFVAPDLVLGTLERGFELYRSLESPFAKAVFMMFLVSEVHPFADGNGRVARIMMNAELVAAGEERIVIPTIYRSNYLTALKALSQTGRAEPLIRTLDYAQKWTLAVGWRALEPTRRALAACNAFLDPGQADADGIRLRMPMSIETRGA